jgi:hypothetical protein
VGESTNVSSGSPRTWPLGGHFLAVVILTVLAAGTRLYRLEQPSLWYDELRTIHGAITGEESWSKRLGYWPHRLWLRMQDVPLEAELAEAPEHWRALGIDEVSARLPATLLGILAVPLLFLVGVRVLGSRVSFVAGLLLALSVWHVYWSQSARFYAIQFLFYNLSLLYYLDWNASRRWGSAAATMVFLVLASLSQPTAVVLYGVFLIDAAVKTVWGNDRRAGLRVFGALLVPIVLVGAAVAVDVARRPDQWAHFFEKANLPPGRLVFSGGYAIGPGVVLVALLGGWGALRRRDDRGVTFLVAALIPFIAFSVFGLFGRVELRYCLVALYAWLCLAALVGIWVFEWAEVPVGRLVATVLVCCLAGSLLLPLYDYMQANGWRPYIREAAAYVQRERSPGDLVFMNPDEGSYYLGEPVAGDAPEVVDEAGGAGPRWVVYRTDERGTLAPPREWLKTHTELRAVFGCDGIQRMARVYVRYRP